MKRQEWTKRAPRSKYTKTGWIWISEHICRKKATMRRYAQLGWGTIRNVQIEDRDEEQGREKEQDEKAEGSETKWKRPKIRRINNNSLVLLSLSMGKLKNSDALVHSQDTFQKVVLKRAAKDLNWQTKGDPGGCQRAQVTGWPRWSSGDRCSDYTDLIKKVEI